MATKQINYILPEFVFLDGESPLGDILEDRTVVMHVQTASVFEVIHMNNVIISEFKARNWDWQYINSLIPYIEDIKLLLHFTTAEDEQLEQVVLKLRDWYFEYLFWKDNKFI